MKIKMTKGKEIPPSGSSEARSEGDAPGENPRIEDIDKDELPKAYNNVMFDYDDLKEDRIGQGSGRLPYFDGQFYDHWKCKMMMYLESMSPHVANITENGFLWENRDNPTRKDQIDIHHNVLTASAIVSALSATEYDKVAGIKNANQLWRKLEVIYEGIDSVKDARLEEL